MTTLMTRKHEIVKERKAFDRNTPTELHCNQGKALKTHSLAIPCPMWGLNSPPSSSSSESHLPKGKTRSFSQLLPFRPISLSTVFYNSYGCIFVFLCKAQSPQSSTYPSTFSSLPKYHLCPFPREKSQSLNGFSSVHVLNYARHFVSRLL